MELIAPPKRTVLRQEMKICHTSFLLKSTLLFSHKSDCGNHVRTFTHEKFGRIFGHTGSPRSLLSELSANLPKVYLMGSGFSRHRSAKFHLSVQISTLRCKIGPP